MTTVSSTAGLRSIALLFASLPVLTLAEGDIAGAADHETLGRFEGATITGYATEEFDEYVLYSGPVAGRDDTASAETLEGALRHIAYRAPEGASLAEVWRNYELKLASAGYTVLFECTDRKACGGTGLAYAVRTLPIPKMSVDPFNYRYLSARLSANGRTESLALLASVDSRKRTRVHLTSLVAGELEDRMVDAEQMAKSLGDEGRVALYGIHFDTDSASIRPESEPTLAQIAALLADAPDLTLIVVGHTDNQGTLEHNMDLSRRRAEQVVDALVASHGVAAGRLSSAGVAYLAPVARNATEDGRALNRRVELIEGK